MFENLNDNLRHLSEIGIINYTLIFITLILFLEVAGALTEIIDYKNYKTIFDKLSKLKQLIILLLELILNIIIFLSIIYCAYFIISNLILIDRWLSELSKNLRCYIGIFEIVLLIIMIKFPIFKKNNAG